MIQKFRVFFLLILGLFFFYWVYKFFAGPESINLILENKYKLIFLVIAYIPTLYFDSLAWLVLMSKNKISVLNSILITWISQTSSKFLPTGNLTGEFVRFYLAKKCGQDSADASSTVLIDLFIATFSLLIIGVFSFFIILLVNIKVLENHYFLYLIASILLIFLACFLFFLLIRKRTISYLIRKKIKNYNLRIVKKNLKSLIRLDYYLYKLSFKKKKLVNALFLRLLGWVSGALEIYIFLWIIGIEANLLDVILIECITAIFRSVAFFIPAGLGVQEFAFVLMGEFVGYSGVVSFSIALGRRLREIMVGVPAMIIWYFSFKKDTKGF